MQGYQLGGFGSMNGPYYFPSQAEFDKRIELKCESA